VYNNKGNTLKELYRFDEALAAYSKAISFKPKYAIAFNNRGNTYKDLNQVDAALADYKKAIFLKPDYAQAHRQISSLTTYTASDDQQQLMKKLIQEKKVPKIDKSNLFYALAKAADDQGLFAQAFKYFKKGGKLRKECLSYSIDQDLSFFTKIKYNALLLAETSLTYRELNPTPIFIIGMPRSGTTLAEKIISSHPDVIAGGELSFWERHGSKIVTGETDLTEDFLSHLKEEYLLELQNITSNHHFVTDKMPQNFRFVGLILSVFPEAKIINMQRNPAATCWSNFTHFFSSNGLGYSYDLKDVVKYYHLYRDLIRFWDKSYGKGIYHLDYEKLTLNPEPEIRKLISFVGLGWSDSCLAPHHNKQVGRTSSQQQVNKPIYQGSSEVWKKYESFLKGAFDEFF
ncbi:sulfotransferase, partial [Candidatus Puniceispirillum sp.]|nr:sulfotransferase [Candidatus Puniceispirillum sp.]